MAELFFDVPLNYSKPNEGQIRLFARSVRRPATFPDTEQNEKPLPWFVYLQGGPGFGCRPPQDMGFVPSVLDKGYQVDYCNSGFFCVISVDKPSRFCFSTNAGLA